MLVDGWPLLTTAAIAPLLVVLTIGIHGVGLVLGWLALAILLWLILSVLVPGRWGKLARIGSIALSSLLAAIIVVSLIGR